MMIDDIKATFKGEKTVGDTIKTLGGMVVGFGADAAVATALTTLATSSCKSGKSFKKFAIGAGIFMLSWKIGEEVEEYFYKTCDGIRDAFRATKDAQQDDTDDNSDKE